MKKKTKTTVQETNVTTNNPATVPFFQSWDVNLKEDFISLLKTLKMYDYPHGMAHTVRILKGWEDSYAQNKEDSFKKFETFGSICHRHTNDIRRIINFAFDKGLIQAANKKGYTLALTAKGLQYLDAPFDFFVKRNKIYYKKYELNLESKLRDIRRQSSEKNSVPAYMIFPTLTIERLVHAKPTTISALNSIPGLSLTKIETYGPGILTVIQLMFEEKQKEDYLSLCRKAKGPTCQATKQLFSDGKSVLEIAKQRYLKEVTVRNHLETLHKAGEIDLKPWIEENVDSKALYKGAEYFKQTENPKMREAYEVLGLDYDVLRFCKLYVSDVSTSYERLAV